MNTNSRQVWATIVSDELPIVEAFKIAGNPLLSVDISKRTDIDYLARSHRQGIEPDFSYDWATALHGNAYSLLLKVSFDKPHQEKFALVFNLPDHYNYLQAVAETGDINLVSGNDYLFSLGINTDSLKGLLNMATVFLVAQEGVK